MDPNPHAQVSIRGIDRDAYSIFAFNGGRRVPIEKDIEKALAFKEAFEGAIYLHMGTPYHVSKLDHEKKEIHVEETKAEYYTKALVNSEIFIKEKYTDKTLPSCKDVRIGLGAVEVVEQVTGYKKFRYFLEGNCGIFVYDGHRGCVGYAEKGYEIITDILEVTLKAIEGCPCSDGCPSCIQSPKCGNHNKPLDKHAAIMILHDLLGKPPYVPPMLKPQKPPINQQKMPDEPEGIGAALNRVRSQLRKDALKQKEPTAIEDIRMHRNSVSSEKKKILDRVKQIEEMQRQHESKKKRR